jgi:hypothetical protein
VVPQLLTVEVHVLLDTVSVAQSFSSAGMHHTPSQPFSVFDAVAVFPQSFAVAVHVFSQVFALLQSLAVEVHSLSQSFVSSQPLTVAVHFSSSEPLTFAVHVLPQSLT